jgi:molybdopterin-guanine dinucleotide biosynthesis protein
MAIVVIGGHSRNIGKTSVVCALISAMPDRRWAAVKITQCKHDVASGETCDCEFGEGSVAVSEEHDATGGTDSSRYLAAGAVRSFWVRTRRGQLAEAMPHILAEINQAENVILESNSVLGFLEPDVYASVLDPEVVDFKASALTYLERADAVLLPASLSEVPTWTGVPLSLIERIPKFRIMPPSYCSDEFVLFVAQRLVKGSSEGRGQQVARSK